jgi:hypothetical protein
MVLALFLDVLILAFSKSQEIADPEAIKIATFVSRKTGQNRFRGQNRFYPLRGTSGGGPTSKW